MNTLRRQPDPAAEEQASLWAARLEGGTLSAADRDALDTWLNADASHRALLSQYCQFSADLEEQLLALVATGGVKLPPEPAAANVVEFEAAPAPRARRWSFPRVASYALAAAAAVALTVWVARPSVRIETSKTVAAQRSSITLSDGSRVELNARTSFTFENGSSERHLHLAGGEAFFTVAKDKSRPFIIDTPSGSVRVTGTVFNVRANQPTEFEVSVVEGSVQVHPSETAAPGAGTFSLGANDCVTVVDGKAVPHSLSNEELADALAWREGKVVFHNTPLDTALESYRRYHDCKIVASSMALAQKKPVGGRYSIDNFDDLMDGLHVTHHLRATHEPNGTIRVTLDTEP